MSAAPIGMNDIPVTATPPKGEAAKRIGRGTGGVSRADKEAMAERRGLRKFAGTKVKLRSATEAGGGSVETVPGARSYSVSRSPLGCIEGRLTGLRRRAGCRQRRGARRTIRRSRLMLPGLPARKGCLRPAGSDRQRGGKCTA